MPTVNVKRDLLFELIGQTFTKSQFEKLCFRYGIELDSETSEQEIASKGLVGEASQAAASAAVQGLDSTALYRIEIPANRYDLLSVEGIAQALRTFLQLGPAPAFTLVEPEGGPAARQTIIQTAATLPVRAHVVGAVLRGVHFTPDSFASFIDLQDKLHQNIGRKRTLVSIGTHDLDTVKGPFTYDARPKKDIKFRPLAEEKEFDVEQLFDYYNHKPNCHLKPYLPITEGFALHPVITDSAGIVCSLPPIINGEHSKITLQTTNVFIEATGTDATKLSVALNMVLASFARYASKPFTVEAVNIQRPDGQTVSFPQLGLTRFELDVAYVNSSIGIRVSAQDMVRYLEKMSMHATLNAEQTTLTVDVPPTRSDILHACDLMEDIAISYGFNDVPRTLPTCYTQGKFNALNSLSDALREQVAQAGFNEVLTWVLLSYDDNYRHMQPRDVVGDVLDVVGAPVAQAATASSAAVAPLRVHPFLSTRRPVTLSNPKTSDFQLVRTSLLPGLLKALGNNQGQVNLPIRLFECGDIGFQDNTTDVGARNERRLGALYCDVRSGFEVVQGLLDRLMEVNGVRFGPGEVERLAQRQKREAARKLQEAADKKKVQKAAKPAKGAAKGAEAKQDDAPVAAAAAAPAAAEAELEEDEWTGPTFSLRASEHPSFFPGRRADVLLSRPAADGGKPTEIVVGHFGILHPDVLQAFQIPYVCSALELNLEHFL